MFITREFIKDSFNFYKILDLVEYNYKGCYQMYIGNIDSYKLNQETFLIAFEHCYHIDSTNGWQHDPKKILRAWIFNKTTNMLDKISPEKLYVSKKFEGYGLKK